MDVFGNYVVGWEGVYAVNRLKLSIIVIAERADIELSVGYFLVIEEKIRLCRMEGAVSWGVEADGRIGEGPAQKLQTFVFIIDGVNIYVTVALVADGNKLTVGGKYRRMGMTVVPKTVRMPAEFFCNVFFYVYKLTQNAVFIYLKKLNNRLGRIETRNIFAVIIAINIGELIHGGVVCYYHEFVGVIKGYVRWVGTHRWSVEQFRESAGFRVNSVAIDTAGGVLYFGTVCCLVAEIENVSLGVNKRAVKGKTVVLLRNKLKSAVFVVEG